MLTATPQVPVEGRLHPPVVLDVEAVAPQQASKVQQAGLLKSRSAFFNEAV